MRAELKFAEELAKKAGLLLKSKFNQKHDITYKGDINIVTEADKMSEDLIIGEIIRVFPRSWNTFRGIAFYHRFRVRALDNRPFRRNN